MTKEEMIKNLIEEMSKCNLFIGIYNIYYDYIKGDN